MVSSLHSPGAEIHHLLSLASSRCVGQSDKTGRKQDDHVTEDGLRFLQTRLGRAEDP